MSELVSIVIPIYNMGETIEDCLASLLKQDYENIEIILVDDGSTDNSYEKCLSISKQDKRIVVYHTVNRGAGPARNYGIEKALGKYIYFPDADDYLEPYAIRLMVKAMNKGSDLVVFGFRNKNVHGKVVLEKHCVNEYLDSAIIRNDYSRYIQYDALYAIQGAPWNKLFTLDVIRKNNVSFPALRRHQDEAFIARYMCFSNKVHFIDEILYTYYVNDTKKEWKKYPKDYIDAVRGLYQERKETILTWNTEDETTRLYIEREFISNVIKAMELLFSPKNKMSISNRKALIVQYIQNTGILSLHNNKHLGKWQSIVLNIAQKGYLNRLYCILFLKTRADKYGIVRLVKLLRKG